VSRLFEDLRNGADGAFVIDDELRVVYWNKAAENILGFTDDDVTGQYCYQLLQGRDERQQLICREHCQVAKMALHSKPVPNYDVRMRTKDGADRWLNISVFTFKMNGGENKRAIVHLFHDSKTLDEKYLAQVIEAIRRYHENPTEIKPVGETNTESLTSREVEILTFLAKGHGTREIAWHFSISPNTVRNHIQNILQKLQVHTRLDAVTHAIKNDLIRY